jgi:hypothetical protein
MIPRQRPQIGGSRLAIADDLDTLKRAIHKLAGCFTPGDRRGRLPLIARSFRRLVLCAVPIGERQVIIIGFQHLIGPRAGNPAGWVQKFPQSIYGLHLKDFVFGRDGAWQDVVVGEGNLDLPALLAALDEAGFDGTTARIREKQKAGDFAGMAAQITDDHLAAFTTEATWDSLADTLLGRYQGIASRLVLYNAGRDPERFMRYGQVARTIVDHSS